MPLPNRVKFLVAGPFMELTNPRLAGDPHGALASLVDEKPRRVIEVCAGTGYTARLVARAHPQAEIVALDLSPEMLATGRRRAQVAKLPQISFVLGDVARLRFEANSFDLAIAAFALHELTAEDRAAAIGEIRVFSGQGAPCWWLTSTILSSCARSFTHMAALSRDARPRSARGPTGTPDRKRWV